MFFMAVSVFGVARLTCRSHWLRVTCSCGRCCARADFQLVEGLFDQVRQVEGVVHGFRRRADPDSYVLVHAREGDVKPGAGRQNRQAKEPDHRGTRQIELLGRPFMFDITRFALGTFPNQGVSDMVWLANSNSE